MVENSVWEAFLAEYAATLERAGVVGAVRVG